MDTETILKEFKSLHKRSHVFPGSNPVSIERKHYTTLLQDPYMVSEKTHGIRYMLFIKTIRGVNVIALINRRQDVQLIDIPVPEPWLQGTILDGEVAIHKQAGIDMFLAFDVLFVSGQDVSHLHFRDRLHAFTTAYRKDHYTPSEHFQIKIKHFIPLQDFAAFMPYYEKVQESFDTDGIVFTPMQQQVIPGKNDAMFKWKMQNDNTIDFFVKLNNDGSNTANAFVFNTVAKKPQLVTKVPVCPDMASDDIWECEFTRKTQSWKPLVKRTDKKYPNSLETYEATLVNIKENIKIIEFMALSERLVV